MTPVPLLSPLRLRTVNPQDCHRKVTWLELFFDLVFVATISRVAAPLSEDYSTAGLVRFAVLFVLVWWAWLGHTFFATRFDTDDLLQRVLTLLQMFTVAVMGINAGAALDTRDSAGFAAAYAVLRLILVGQYVRASTLETSRPLSVQYAVGLGTAALLWLVSAFVPVPWRFWIWGMAFVVDVGTPLLAERHGARLPPDPEHLPERFGLFTIILLGEAVVAVMGGMRSQEMWSPAAATSALASLAILFLFWWWYFDGAGGAAERHVRTAADTVRLRVWSYAHLPVYLGLALTGIGLEHLIHVAVDGTVHGTEALMLGGSVATVMVSLVVLTATNDRDALPALLRRAGPGLAVALVTPTAGWWGDDVRPVALVVSLVLLTLAQALLAFAKPAPLHRAVAHEFE